ncbi:MAG: hypothetical protein Q9187_003191 [Circinaria calcarea]
MNRSHSLILQHNNITMSQNTFEKVFESGTKEEKMAKVDEEEEEEARRQKLLKEQAAKKAAVQADKAAALKKRQEEIAASKAGVFAPPAPTSQRPLHPMVGTTTAVPMPRPGMTMQEQSDVLYRNEADQEAMQARRGGGTWGGPSRGYRSAAPIAPLSTRSRAPPNAPTGPAVRGGIPGQERGAREVSQPSAETVKRQEAQLQHWKVAQKEKQRLQGTTAKVASLENRIFGKVEKKASTPTQRGGSFQIRGTSRLRGNIPLGPRSASVRPTQAMRPPPIPSPARPSAPPVSQSGDVAIELARINLERERLVSERERERLALERETERERLALELKKTNHQIAMDMMRLGENRGRLQEMSAQPRRRRSRSASPRRRSPTHYDGYRTPRSPAEQAHGSQSRSPTRSRYPAPGPPTPAFAPAYTPSVASQRSHSIRSGSSWVSQEEFSRNWLPRQGIRAGNQALHDSQAVRARLRAREREMELMKQKIAAKELAGKRKAEAAITTTAKAEHLYNQISTTPRATDEDRPALGIRDTAPVIRPENAPDLHTIPEGFVLFCHAESAGEYINGLEESAQGFKAAWEEAYNSYVDSDADTTVVRLLAARVGIEDGILATIQDLLNRARGLIDQAATVAEVDDAVNFLNAEALRLGIDGRRVFSNIELLNYLPRDKLGPLVVSEFTKD